jgi:predicted nucleotidyltransferase
LHEGVNLDMEIRRPRAEEWGAILAVANEAVGAVRGSGSQEEWLRNRRDFSSRGSQSEFVCIDSGEVVGYGAAERGDEAPADDYRLFVVTSPERLRSVGERILGELNGYLARVNARRSWLREYAADVELTNFLIAHGYKVIEYFELEGGTRAVVLEKLHQ